MSQILDGQIIRSEGTENASGGTELMMDRMVRDLPSDLLNKVQIIHSRLNTTSIANDRPTILVCHDLPNDPMYKRLTNPDILKKIDVVVFVSYWQKQYFNLMHGLPHEKSVVIQNGIEPFPSALTDSKLYKVKPNPSERINVIYHTTPHRGLEILVPVFQKLVDKYGQLLHLDVFSSFEAYGWKERDGPYEHLFQTNDNITYHGFQPNSVVRKQLTSSHIFGYPCIWPETSCLAAIEALSSGNLVVCSDLAALPETTANFANLYQFKNDKEEHASIFYRSMQMAIEQVQAGRDERFQTAYFNSVYDWNNRIAPMWKSLLEGF